MGTTQIIFWALAVLSVVAGIGVIASRKPTHSVISLIIVFFTLSGQYILMNAQFLAIVNIIVGVGAIMVLFLFLIRIMKFNQDEERRKNVYMKLAGIVASLTLMVVLIAAVAHAEQNSIHIRPGTPVGFIEYLGLVLFGKFIIPLEISGVLLLSASVGIIITWKEEKIKSVKQ